MLDGAAMLEATVNYPLMASTCVESLWIFMKPVWNDERREQRKPKNKYGSGGIHVCEL